MNKPVRFTLGEKKVTNRGFGVIEFKDRYNNNCSIQKSSLAGEDCIWIGISEADPKIMASTIIEGGTGWAKYPLPEGVSINTRMHLNQEQAKAIVEVLNRFIETGNI